jgi:hypothetical protein
MKKAMCVLALLAIPAVAFAGTATMSLKYSDGTSVKTVDAGLNPTWSGTISVSVYIDAYAGAPEAISNFGGSLSSASTVFSVATGTQRTLTGCGPFVTGDTWGALVGNGLAGAIPSVKDFGAAATTGGGHYTSFGNYGAPEDGALPWQTQIITVTVTNAPAGSTQILKIANGYVGTTENDGVDPVALDTDFSGNVTLNIIPEPATMLLLAAALPFLRRRSA